MIDCLRTGFCCRLHHTQLQLMRLSQRPHTQMGRCLTGWMSDAMWKSAGSEIKAHLVD